jgi:hypothetical protein
MKLTKIGFWINMKLIRSCQYYTLNINMLANIVTIGK